MGRFYPFWKVVPLPWCLCQVRTYFSCYGGHTGQEEGTARVLPGNSFPHTLAVGSWYARKCDPPRKAAQGACLSPGWELWQSPWPPEGFGLCYGSAFSLPTSGTQHTQPSVPNCIVRDPIQGVNERGLVVLSFQMPEHSTCIGTS